MASIGSFFKSFISLILLLIHLGCFPFSIKDHLHSPLHSPKKKKQRKVTPISHSPSSLPSHSDPPSKTHKLPHSLTSSLSSISSFVKKIIPSNLPKPSTHPPVFTASEPSSPLSSTRSSLAAATPTAPPPKALLSEAHRRRNVVVSRQDSHNSLSYNAFLPLRNDIFPCPGCGEIFQNPKLLEQHLSSKHAVSELRDGESGRNVIQIIFETAWSDKARSPRILRVLKINNSSTVLARFEEYRESVKLRAARNGVVRKRDERCLADGNELLRFRCSTFLCNLGDNGSSDACGHTCCSVCGIIRAGFPPKLDGIATMSSSSRAHVAIPDDMDQELSFMNVKRAMLVCRVVAGRVGFDPVDKEDPACFDSLVARRLGPQQVHRFDDEELVVFNPTAVLPCFVIVYSV